MAGIAEPLRPPRILANPKRFAPLRSFSCGRRGEPWEKAVNEWTRGLYLGTEAHAQTIVVVEDATGRLVGVCGFRADPIPIRAGSLVGSAQCIHMLGTDRLFHGRRLEDGSRPGDVLLRGALEHIETARDGRMPYVWALVSPDNDRSRALFDRHGFGELPYSGEGEIIHVRAPHKRLPMSLRRRGSRRQATRIA